MKKIIVLTCLVLSSTAVLSVIAVNRNNPRVEVKMHIKDLPEHNLTLLGPQSPAFDQRLRTQLQDKTSDFVDVMKTTSVFFENNNDRTIVGYTVQWAFTRTDGSNDYYRKVLLSPQALIEKQALSMEAKQQGGQIEPGSAAFLSLVDADGRGVMRIPLRGAEAEAAKKGVKLDRSTMVQRFSEHLANYTDITVSIDGVIFDDGTFVGPDTTNFFAQAQAVVAAKRDLLLQISDQLQSKKQLDKVYKTLEEVVEQPSLTLNANSTRDDFYKQFKQMYANEILQMRTAQGDEKALKTAIQPLGLRWLDLKKRN